MNRDARRQHPVMRWAATTSTTELAQIIAVLISRYPKESAMGIGIIRSAPPGTADNSKDGVEQFDAAQEKWMRGVSS